MNFTGRMDQWKSVEEKVMVERGDEKVMVDGAKIQIDKLRLTFESVERPL